MFALLSLLSCRTAERFAWAEPPTVKTPETFQGDVQALGGTGLIEDGSAVQAIQAFPRRRLSTHADITGDIHYAAALIEVPRPAVQTDLEIAVGNVERPAAHAVVAVASRSTADKSSLAGNVDVDGSIELLDDASARIAERSSPLARRAALGPPMAMKATLPAEAIATFAPVLPAVPNR